MSLGAPSAFFSGENSSSRSTSQTANSLHIANITRLAIIMITSIICICCNKNKAKILRFQNLLIFTAMVQHIVIIIIKAIVYIRLYSALPLTDSCSSKSRLVLSFWYRLIRVVPNKGPLNWCCCTELIITIIIILCFNIFV